MAAANCMIIDALMNGINPTAMIENCSNVPHKSIAKYSKPPPDCIVLDAQVVISTNGTGIYTNSLYRAKIANVKSSFFLIDLFEIIP